MTEQEFTAELKKHGLEEKEIKGLLNIYRKIKKNDTDLTLNEWLGRAAQANKEAKKEPEGFLTL